MEEEVLLGGGAKYERRKRRGGNLCMPKGKLPVRDEGAVWVRGGGVPGITTATT